VQADAEDAGQPVTVSVTGPAIITDASGASTGGPQQQITLVAQGQAHFWVTGTSAGAITVRVDLPYQLGAGSVFSHLGSGAPTQRLVLAEGHALIASVTGELSLSASAPQPPPTEQATSLPTQVAELPTAPPPPPPTRRPSRRSATPTPAEQPTETAISETQATAMSTLPADTSATPTTSTAAGGQAPPTSQGAAGAAVGGANLPRPASLPNTGSPDAYLGWLLLVGAGSLALGGWLIRRRVHS